MLNPRTRFPFGAKIVALVALTGLLVFASRASAHEIPTSVVVNAFVKPEGDVLRVLVRVPLNSMRDVNFPIRGTGFLEVSEAEPFLREGAQLWILDYVEFYEEDRRLDDARIVAIRVSEPGDPSFQTYGTALEHLLSPPLPEGTEVFWEQALLDVMIEYSIESQGSDFLIDPTWAHLGIYTTTVLRYQGLDGTDRMIQYTGAPGLVRLDPTWYHAAMQFVSLGFFHILEGLDHLLFVFLLVIPFRRILPLLAIVTSFTIAHSITLAASALELTPSAPWFPPLVEWLVALSIVYMAVENIVGAKLQRRWFVAFGFGLIHGFGFSFALRESLQFAGAHLTMSLLAFNVGVELGQILVLVLSIPLLELLFRFVVRERLGTIILSGLVAHAAWHWMDGLWANVRQMAIEMPAMDLALLAGALRWLLLLLVLAGVMWVLLNGFQRLIGRGGPPPEVEPASSLH